MKLDFPIIVVNFKAYNIDEPSLANICDDVSADTGKPIAVCVQTPDINRVSSQISIPVFAQHIDADEFGSHTGDVIAETVKQNGAIGTLINHSEKRLRMDVIEKTIIRAKEAGLITIVCVNTPQEAGAVAEFLPDVIAIEPPELIGGDISVTTANPNIIIESIKHAKNIPVLCGAGVKTSKDVKKALELGAKGVLLASGITKAKNPKEILTKLADAL